MRLFTGRRRNSAQLELTKVMIVLRHGALALSNLDVHSRLVVLVSGEDLRLLHCSTIGYSFIRIDATVRLLAIEEILG